MRKVLDNIDPKSEHSHPVTRKRNRKFLVGNTMNTAGVETVPRLAWLHVTRLKPETKSEELSNFLKENLTDVICELHSSKKIYASMKVTFNHKYLQKCLEM